MIENMILIETSIQEKTGRFFLDHDTPIGVAKEMHFQIGVILAQIEAQIKAKVEEEKAKQSSDSLPKADVLQVEETQP